MNAEILLRHFDAISEAPDAVARLRRFVLDLAVRGKLVAQDSSEGTGAELVRRIEAERARLVAQKGARKEKSVAPISAAETPFGIPSTWCWARLQQLTSYIQRGKSPKYSTGDGPPVISQKCVQWSGIQMEWAKAITPESLESYEPIRFLCDGDLLWNSTGTGTIGRVVRVSKPIEQLVCDSHVTVVRCLLVDEDYIRLWLRSDHVYGTIEKRAAGATNQVELTASMANNQAVPVPPLAEQQRIVAHVNELMTLCDELEAAREKREVRRGRLVLAALEGLTEVDHVRGQAEVVDTTTPDFFALANMTLLTTRAEHVQKLRFAILDLAIQGRLTSRSTEEGTGRVQLEAARVAKQEAAKLGRKGREPLLPEISEAEIPFSLPREWEWTRLGDVAVKITDGEHSTPKRSSSGYFLLSARNVTNEGISLANVDYVPEEEFNRIRRRCDPNIGDVLISCSGSVGRVALVDRSEAYSMVRSAAMVRPIPTALIPAYLALCLRSPTLQRQMVSRSKQTAQANLFLGQIANLVVPIPALAEQQRIVERVDMLFAICNQLEHQITASARSRSHLLEAVISNTLSDHLSNVLSAVSDLEGALA